jgi:nickel transport protein
MTLAGPVQAHQVHVFATAEGCTIRGEVYVRGGEPVRKGTVKALGPSGDALGETTTDDEGKFSLPAQYRCDYRLVVDAGGGHTAEYTLPADELPESLPLPAAEKPASGATPVSGDPEAVTKPSVSSVGEQAISSQLESLNRQIVQLRKQLDGYEQKVRLHDILGGIGYIVGLMGLAAYFAGARRNKREGNDTRISNR